MRIKVFFVLLLCALQRVDGSKFTKRKGESRLKNWAKNCLIALAVNYGANEVINPGKPQAAEPSFFACKYNVPNRNARVMMNFVMCARDQGFEKYMFDNSENCPKIKELYNQAESDQKCAFNTPKIISDGAFARFRGEQLSHATNMEMVKEYLLSYSDKDGVLFESEESVSDFLHEWKNSIWEFPEKDIDFFQFTSILEWTKLAYPDSALYAVSMALRSTYKGVNVDNAKCVLELTKLAYPDDISSAVAMALRSAFQGVNVENAKKLLNLTNFAFPDDTYSAVTMAFHKCTDINVDHAKKLLELTKFAFHNNPYSAVMMALESEYKDVNADNAKKLFELTKIAFPNKTYWAVAMALQSTSKDVNADKAKEVFQLTKLVYPDMKVAVSEALKPKYKDVNVDKVNEKYQELKSSWLWYLRGKQNIMKEALKVTYPEVLKEDF